MQLLELTSEQIKIAKQAVSSRFLANSVANQCIPIEIIDKNETITRWNRYDYNRSSVVDNETLTLPEPYTEVNLSRAQRDEASLKRGLTTIHRKTSELARLFDALAFVGLNESIRREIAQVTIPDVEACQNFVSLREAAMQVEEEESRGPILVEPSDSQESLVSAVFKAVFNLESYGYYSAYFSIWGERSWSLLHKTSRGSLVLPKEQVDSTIDNFYRSTTLPSNEALVVSLDGPTLKYVVAAGVSENMGMGSESTMQEEYLFFEPLRIATDDRNEERYKYRVRFRAVPCVQENRSIIRIKLAESETPEY